MMPLIGPSEAARLTGRDLTTINRAMKTGRLSYEIQNGKRRIDTSELHRAFPETAPAAATPPEAPHRQSPKSHEADEARTKALIEAHEATIRDLRARLDAADEERRRLTAVLTDQRPAKEETRPPVTLWGRFLAWRLTGR